MRSFSRADLVPAVLDALLEGSLVGVAYVALYFAAPAPRTPAPLSLAEFVAAAAIGLAWSRLWPRTVRRRLLWLAPAIVTGGLLGWLADPVARGILPDLSRALGAHSAGWLVGLAVYRGAAHERGADEIETSSRALAFAFPVLAAPWILDQSHRPDVAGVAIVGAAVCVGSGLLAIAYARVRQLGLANSGTQGSRTWPVLVTSVVLAIVIVAIPAALLTGTSARDALLAIAGPLGGAIASAIALFFEAVARLASPFAGLAPQVRLPSLPGVPSVGLPPEAATLLWIAAAIAVAFAAFRVYRLVAGTPSAAKVPKVRGEERRLELHLPRVGLHLPAPTLHAHLELPRRPRTAIEAYLTLLRDLAHREPLARGAAETPRRHARRASGAGLPSLPMTLLAADYELSAYGGSALTERETHRALARYRRLRSAANAIVKPR